MNFEFSDSTQMMTFKASVDEGVAPRSSPLVEYMKSRKAFQFKLYGISDSSE